VAFQTLCPNFFSAISESVDRHILPEARNIGHHAVKGMDSRGGVPNSLTAVIDTAAVRNNETHRAPMAVDRR
jgi:hypothetical protein